MIWIVIICWALFAATAQAATYYIDDAGSDAANGTSTATPWLTWAHAFSNSACGDTLVVMNGTYATATHGIPTLTKACSSSTPYTVQAQNQRQAHISSDGVGNAFRVTSSAYVVVDGLRISSTDNSSASSNYDNVSVESSSFVTFKNGVLDHNNRYKNTALIRLLSTDDSLVEGNELYYYHRHGIQLGGNSDRNVVRLNYCNSRGYADIPGGFPSGSSSLADSCVTNYTSGGSVVAVDNIIENNISESNWVGFWSETLLGPHRAKWKGNISLNDSTGFLIKARGSSLNSQPYQQELIDNIVINPSGVGMYLRGNRETTVRGATIYDSSSNSGFLTDVEDAYPGSGTYSFTAESLLSTLNTTGIFITETPTWTCTNCKAFGNTTNYNPSSSANYTPTNPPTATDPQLGTCRAWRPDGSNAKANNWGADILYRYQNGVLQDGSGGASTVPLWDPITGAFPHGATVTGLNDVAGSSLFDVHERLNINMNGCQFPSGYGGSGPTNPSNVVATTNEEGAHVHVVPSGTKALTVVVMVRWDTPGSGAAAQPTSVTSSCGSEAIPNLDAVATSPAGDRTSRPFGLLDPTPGTCTLTPTFSSTNWSGWAMISVDDTFTDLYGDLATTSGTGITPTGTVSTASDEELLIFLTTSNVPTLSVPAGQILVTDKSHATKNMRGALSTKSGAAGGVGGWNLSITSGWIQHIISRVPVGGGGGTTPTFTITHYRCDGLLGSTGTPEVTLGQLAAQDTACQVGLNGALRLRLEVGVSVADSTQTSVAPYCKKVGGAFAKVQNTFGSNYVRYYGPGIEPNIPVDGTPTTKRFSGSPFQAGVVKRDGSTPFLLAPIANGTETEVDILVVIGNGLVPGTDTVQCELQRDDGTTLGTHSNTITITPVTPTAAMGF